MFLVVFMDPCEHGSLELLQQLKKIEYFFFLLLLLKKRVLWYMKGFPTSALYIVKCQELAGLLLVECLFVPHFNTEMFFCFFLF